MPSLKVMKVNGLRYACLRAGVGPPLLLLHGFTGAAENWVPHMPALADCAHTLAVDLPGHGASGAPSDTGRHALEAVATDLVELMRRLGHAHFHLLGYSLGGRLALQLALAWPERVCSLILESASPGIMDADERARRRFADETLAARIEHEGIPAFVARWEHLPLFASQAQLPADARRELRAQRLRNRPAGLAGSLRGAGAGAMIPLWSQLGELKIQTLLLAGALDAKYVAIARRMAAKMPMVRLEVLPQSGHCIHLERPRAFQRILRAFLAENGSKPC